MGLGKPVTFGDFLKLFFFFFLSCLPSGFKRRVEYFYFEETNYNTKLTENSGIIHAILAGSYVSASDQNSGTHVRVATILPSKCSSLAQKNILTLSLITFKRPQNEPLYIYSSLKDLFNMISTTFTTFLHWFIATTDSK